MNQKFKMFILEVKSQFYRLVRGYYVNKTLKYMYYRDKSIEYHKKIRDTQIELKNTVKN